MSAQLNILDVQNAELTGVLSHQVANQLEMAGLKAIEKAASGSKVWTVDFSKVTQSSSVGIAIMLSWMRSANAKKVELNWQNLPDNMREIIHFSGLAPVFKM